MASVVALPFNNQPVDTIYTSSRTLAAGEYAYCIPKSPACTVDAVYVFECGSFSRAGVNTVTGVVPLSFTGRIATNSASSTKDLCLSTQSIGVSASGTTAIDVFFLNGQICSVVSGAVQGVALAGVADLINYASGSNTTVTVTSMNLEPIWLSNQEVLAGGPWVIHIFNKVT